MNQQVCRFNKCMCKGTVLKLVTNYGLSGLCCVPMAAAVPVEGKKMSNVSSTFCGHTQHHSLSELVVVPSQRKQIISEKPPLGQAYDL